MISPRTISFHAYRGTSAGSHSIFRGAPVKFVAVFDDEIDLTGCTSLRLDLMASSTDTGAPLATKEITVIPASEYSFIFSSAQTNHANTEAWLVLTAYYPEGVGEVDDNLDPLYVANISIAPYNAGLLAPSPPSAAIALTQAQADERYLINSGNTDILLGRYTAGTGVFQEIALGTNLTLSELGVLDASLSSQNTFQTIAVSGQSNVAADASGDTLTLAAGSNVQITTNATTDTITISADEYAITTFAELQAAVASSAQQRLHLYSDITLTADITIPSNITIFFRNKKFISSGFALQFNGNIDAKRTQIFQGFEAGDIYGNFSTNEVFPEWWGLVGSTALDGQHDLAINAAIRTYGPRGTLTVSLAEAGADPATETKLTVTSIYSPATYYIEVGIRIRVEATSLGDTEYDGWWTVSAVTSTTVTIKKAWTGNTMTGSAYFTIRGGNGNRVSLAAGTYYINSTLDARDAYCQLVGAGSGCTSLVTTTNWTPSEWFSGAFYVWQQLNTDPNYSPLGWDAGMTTDDTSHAYVVMFGSSSSGGGADFRAGMSGLAITAYNASTKWPIRRISILGGNGWAEENHIFRDLTLSWFTGFGIGWWSSGSINTLNGPLCESIWINKAMRRGSIPIYSSSSSGVVSFNSLTIDCSLQKSQTSAWATDDTALGGTVAGTGNGTFTADVSNVITTSVAHGLKVGDEVRFATTTTLPAGLTVGTRYYVLTVPGDYTMTVAATPDGAEINITDTGSGPHWWIGYLLDYPIFGCYVTGSHTSISNIHIEGCIKGIWVWGSDAASTVTITNADGYALMDANMAYAFDPARVGGPETVSRSADGTCFKYSALVGIGSQFGQSGEAENFNSDVSIVGLRCVGYVKYRLQDYSNGLEISSYGSGQYPQNATGTVIKYHRWQRYPAHTVTSTITTAATDANGTLLTVASSTGVSPGDTIYIASSSNQDTDYDYAFGWEVHSVPSGTQIVIIKTWETDAEMTGTFWKKSALVTTNYEISY